MEKLRLYPLNLSFADPKFMVNYRSLSKPVNDFNYHLLPIVYITALLGLIMSKTPDTKDVFGIYEQNINSSFATINREVPKYHQSITDLQQQCIQTCENTMKSVLSVQKEIVNKAGINASIPDAALTSIKEMNDGINKVYSVQNQIVQTALDATKQNIKTFNDNAKAFADLNKNIIQSYINVFTPRNN